MKKGKILGRVIIAIILLLFIGFIFNIVNSIYGNPISAAIATSKIKIYIDRTYPEEDLEISKAIYNFKFDEYYSYVKSKTSEDTSFSVSWSKGQVTDDYEIQVKRHYATYKRLQRELDNKVEELIRQEFPCEISTIITHFYGDREDYSNLILDMPLDITNPPYPTMMTIYILSKEISYEILRDRLTELWAIMEENKTKIDYYTVIIQEPMSPEGEKAAIDGKSLGVYNFPAENIKSGNLMEEIKDAKWQLQGNK